MEQKKITFDSFVRGVLTVIVIVVIIMLLKRLSAVLLPFFLAWLIAYLLFPLVKFFQYKCHMKFRILGILSTFLVMGIVATILLILIVPPMIDEAVRVKELAVMFISSNENLRNVPDLIEDFIREHLTKEDIKALYRQAKSAEDMEHPGTVAEHLFEHVLDDNGRVVHPVYPGRL